MGPGVTPGPITADACCRQNCGPNIAQHGHSWLWVPDRVRCAHLSGTTGINVPEFPFQTAKDATPHSRGAMRPSRAWKIRPEKTEGVGNAGCPMHPQPRVQK